MSAIISWHHGWDTLTTVWRLLAHRPGAESEGVATCTLDREARIRYLLGATVQPMYLSDAMLSANLLRAEREVAVQALAFQERETIRITANQDQYTLSSDYVTSWALHLAPFTAGLRLYDSASVAWYLVVSPAGDASFTATIPPVVLGTGTPTSLRLTDELGTFRYISPSTGGVITISTSAPAGTQVTSTVLTRDAYGSGWNFTVTSASQLVPTRGGSGTLSGANLEPRALVYVDPRSFERLDPVATSTTPLYYTVYASKQLRVSPVPTITTDMVHYYFSDGLLDCDFPPQFEQEAIWYAIRLALLQRGHASGVAAAQKMVSLGLERLGPRYFPRRDTLENYTLPSYPRLAP